MVNWLWVLIFAAANEPAAVPLLQGLPPDGSWAQYGLRLQAAGQDHSLQWAVRAVGRFQLSGRDVQCLETELSGAGSPIPPNVHRLLVPLDAFGPDKHALEHTVRMWVKRDSEPVETFDSLDGDPITALFLRGATENVKRLPQKEAVQWQRGKLECDVFTGRSRQMIGTAQFTTEWTILRHAEVPFGLGGLRMKLTTQDSNDVIDITLTLQDHGKDAQPALPELRP